MSCYTVSRLDLRKLVDEVWQHVTESLQVPDTRVADALIDRAVLGVPPSPGVLDESWREERA